VIGLTDGGPGLTFIHPPAGPTSRRSTFHTERLSAVFEMSVLFNSLQKFVPSILRRLITVDPDEFQMAPSLLTREMLELERLVRTGLLVHPSDLVSCKRHLHTNRVNFLQPAYIDAAKSLSSQGIDDRLLLARISSTTSIQSLS
jgi:hypothetical protein